MAHVHPRPSPHVLLCRACMPCLFRFSFHLLVIMPSAHTCALCGLARCCVLGPPLKILFQAGLLAMCHLLLQIQFEGPVKTSAGQLWPNSMAQICLVILLTWMVAAGVGDEAASGGLLGSAGRDLGLWAGALPHPACAPAVGPGCREHRLQ